MESVLWSQRGGSWYIPHVRTKQTKLCSRGYEQKHRYGVCIISSHRPKGYHMSYCINLVSAGGGGEMKKCYRSFQISGGLLDNSLIKNIRLASGWMWAVRIKRYSKLAFGAAGCSRSCSCYVLCQKSGCSSVEVVK